VPHHFLDNRSEESVFLLEAVFILRKEPVKIMEEHALENGTLRMSRAVDSCHGKDRIQKMNQKPEGYIEDQIPLGKDNRLTNLMLHYVHRNQQ
jgi:hypothetical protein